MINQTQKFIWKWSSVIMVASCLMSAMVLPGCGRSLGASVSGKVTVDGKPIDKGNIVFHPVNGGSLPCAPIMPDSTYKLQTGTIKGIKPGEYIVTVAAFSRVPEPGMNEAAVAGMRLAPAKYGSKETSDLKVTIEPGNNPYDIEMKSR